MDEPLKKYQHKLELKDLKKELPKTFTKVACPSCAAPVPADNLNIHDKIAKCNECDALFALQNEIEALSDKKKMAHEILRPEGIDIFHFKNEMDITLQQPFTYLDFITMIAISLFAFFSTFLYYESAISLMSVLVGWGLISLLIGYFIIRRKHKLHINIDDQYLNIEWRPKKGMKDKHYRISEIDQLYVNVTDGYNLHMIVNGDNGQRHIKLISNLTSRSKAKFIEQEIEKKLNISNKRVPEEM